MPTFIGKTDILRKLKPLPSYGLVIPEIIILSCCRNTSLLHFIWMVCIRTWKRIIANDNFIICMKHPLSTFIILGHFNTLLFSIDSII